MTPGLQVDRSWVWHPAFSETRQDTAGLFVHFRKSIVIHQSDPPSLKISITADTRYKLFINGGLAGFGPVKGDQELWFNDEVEIGPFLRTGTNTVEAIVLRYFYGTKYARSFPRLPTGGLRVVADSLLDGNWETAIDPRRTLRVDEPEDDFLHVYERLIPPEHDKMWVWVPAVPLEFRVSTGNSAPWHLAPRMIPTMRQGKSRPTAIHNVKSPVDWRGFLDTQELLLPAGTTHTVDLEMPWHTTAFVRLLFETQSTARITITYSESYEDPPAMIPYLRKKKHRRDSAKMLFGPKDIYDIGHCDSEVAPFHWRTFRFLQLHVEVGPTDLALQALDIETTNYPLDVQASVSGSGCKDLWETSIRTLGNCMHDCYEDCPFYEQLQYAMDARSSALFTYYAAGDDRMAKQAIVQLHNSFRPAVGLTASRAPAGITQIIPPFALFWVLMVEDNLQHSGDQAFARRFLPVVDAVLGYFGDRVGQLGLVVLDQQPGVWNFVDWAEAWRPYGVPPAVSRTGISTYLNLLYVYTLKAAVALRLAVGAGGVENYLEQAECIGGAVRRHCFDGTFFTDTVACDGGYSQHSQIWAVLAGVVEAKQGQWLLTQCLCSPRFTPTSLAMSFYMLRALSAAGGDVYNRHFHDYWKPWRQQLALGLTTWEEDSVSQRSDCHAWGSAPIYEFTAEVMGIRPLQPGWSSISFRPRIELFRSFSGTVPMGSRGRAQVEWRQVAPGVTDVSLGFDEHDTPFPVLVSLPGMECSLLQSTDDLKFTVRVERAIDEIDEHASRL